MGNAHSLWLTLGTVLLVGWMLVRRFRRFTGAQPLDAGGRRALIVRALLLSVLGLVLLVLSHPNGLDVYAADLLGLLLGVGLAFFAVRHTRFERDAAGEAVRYVPNGWIGGAVFALFVLRLVVRLLPTLTGTAAAPPTTDLSGVLAGNPLTLGLFLLFASYQAAYAVLVLRQSRPHALQEMPV